MRYFSFIIILTLFISCNLNPAYSQLADSPWPMFKHDLQHTGRSPYKGPDTPYLKWKYKTIDVIASSPAIGPDGTIYVGSGDTFSTFGAFFAVNPDGTLKWGKTIGKVSSSPAIDIDGTIYIGSENFPYLYAFNPDGSIKWKYDNEDGIDNSSPAIGPDGTIYFSTFDGDGFFFAINSDGTYKWSCYPLYFSNSSPAVGTDGTIYTIFKLGYTGYKQTAIVRAIEPNGDLKWEYETDYDYDFGGSPAIGPDGTIYASNVDNGDIYAINPDGTLKWNVDIGCYWAYTPSIALDGTIYIASNRDKSLFAFNPDGTQKWQFKDKGHFYSSPAIDSEGTIYLGSDNGHVYAINPDGSEKWNFEIEHNIKSSPAIGSDGTLYIGAYDNYLYAIWGEPQESPTPTLTPTATYTITPTPTVTPPCDEVYFGFNTFADYIGDWEDTYVSEANSNSNYGSDQYLYFDNTAGEREYTHIRLNINSLPDAVDILEAQLYFYVEEQEDTGQYNVSVDGLAGTPGENWAESGDTFYMYNKDISGAFWTDMDGGNLDRDVELGSTEWTPGTGWKFIEFNTAGLFYLELMTGDATCNFIVGVDPDEGQTESYGCKVVSSEHSNKTLPPFLRLVYCPVITATPTVTITPTITKTSTVIPTPGDSKPVLSDGKVVPNTGFQSTSFEYLVYYKDADGGIPSMKRVYINGTYYTMNLKSGSPSDGWYNYLIQGYDLNLGQNEFYFYFADDEMNVVKLPELGAFEGPWVEEGITPTPEGTMTQTPTITETPTAVQTPTSTMTPLQTTTPTATITPDTQNCLWIASPEDFYYNTLLLSWTPVFGVEHYKFEYVLFDEIYSFDLADNWLRTTAQSEFEWMIFVNLGTVFYRVTAFDSEGNVIHGPTEWANFTCYPPYANPVSLNYEEINNKGASPGCLRIASPTEFYFNTLLLSWTPMDGAHHYVLKYRVSNWVFMSEVEDNWLRIIFGDELQWNDIKNLGNVYYSVTAIDPDGNVIDGPTGWSYFTCK